MIANRIGIVLMFWLAMVSTATAQELKGDLNWLDSGSAPTTLPPIFNSPPPYLEVVDGTTKIICCFGRSKIEESLEWMAADASIVFVAIVTDAELASPRVTTVTVQESIKGGLSPGATIAFELTDRDPCVRGDQALFFLDEHKNSVRLRYKERAGRSAIVLSSPQAVRMDRSLLTKPKEIIDAVRSASKFKVDRTKKPIAIARSSLTGGGAILVPHDQRIEELAQTWAASNSLEDRVTALRVMRDFKSQQNIAVAQRLLWDTRMAGGQGKWQIGTFPVRAEAHRLLVDWSIAHPYLPEMGPAYVYEPLSFPAVFLLWIAGAGLLIVGLVILCGWGHRVVFSSTMAFFCVMAIGVISWLWIRSNSRVDELMFRVGDNHHEIASYHFGLQYQVVRQWTLPSKMVFGSFDLRIQDDVWSASALNTVFDRQLAGFMSGHGNLTGPAGAIQPYNVFRLPYWILILPFAVVLMRKGYLAARQVRRWQLGQCRNCGYDLRENPEGRCPECGVESAGRLKTGEEAAIGKHPVGV